MNIWRSIRNWLKQTQGTTLVILMIGIVFLTGAGYKTVAAQNEERSAISWSMHSFNVLLLSEHINAETSLIDQRSRDLIYRHDRQGKADVAMLMADVKLKYRELLSQVRDSAAQTANVKASYRATLMQFSVLTALINQYGSEDAMKIKPENIHSGILRPASRWELNGHRKLRDFNKLEAVYLQQRETVLISAQEDARRYLLILMMAGIVLMTFTIKSAIAANMTIMAREQLEEREEQQIALMMSEQKANEQSRLLGSLNAVLTKLLSEHNLATIIQDVVDYGVAITEAEFGAFFSIVDRDGVDTLKLESTCGTEYEDDPEERIRPGDIWSHSIFERNGCDSRLFMPVVGTTGNRIGIIVFGHSECNRFSPQYTNTIRGLAAMSAIVIENAKLYTEIQNELDDRKKHEEELLSAARRQKLLLGELNHRVKNTLVTVQSLAIQTKNGYVSKQNLKSYPERLRLVDALFDSFCSRLLSLSSTHDLLVNGAWGDVTLNDAVMAALRPLMEQHRFVVKGPKIMLSPNAAVTLNMVFHELATNAIKYGSLSGEHGLVSIEWLLSDGIVKLLWIETGGPLISQPDSQGFGTKLLNKAITREMKGRAGVTFLPEGLECFIEIPLSTSVHITE